MLHRALGEWVSTMKGQQSGRTCKGIGLEELEEENREKVIPCEKSISKMYKLWLDQQNLSSQRASLVAQWQRIHLLYRRHGFDPWVGKIPWRREWQPSPGLFPGESHGQRNLAGYSLQGCTESDMTERDLTRVHAHTHTHTHIYLFKLFSMIGFYKTLNMVPCAIQQVLVVYFM